MGKKVRRVLTQGKYFCNSCKEWKYPEEFYNQSNSPSGKSYSCKKCRDKNRKFRKYHLKTRYGITEQDYDGLLNAQKSKCAICGSSTSKDGMRQKLYIDHCHKTNKVRGLLCKNCNLAIGLFEDKKENLRNAIKYLEKEVI